MHDENEASATTTIVVPKIEATVNDRIQVQDLNDNEERQCLSSSYPQPNLQLTSEIFESNLRSISTHASSPLVIQLKNSDALSEVSFAIRDSSENNSAFVNDISTSSTKKLSLSPLAGVQSEELFDIGDIDNEEDAKFIDFLLDTLFSISDDEKDEHTHI
jgi:hypothetical protein